MTSRKDNLRMKDDANTLDSNLKESTAPIRRRLKTLKEIKNQESSDTQDNTVNELLDLSNDDIKPNNDQKREGRKRSSKIIEDDSDDIDYKTSMQIVKNKSPAKKEKKEMEEENLYGDFEEMKIEKENKTPSEMPDSNLALSKNESWTSNNDKTKLKKLRKFLELKNGKANNPEENKTANPDGQNLTCPICLSIYYFI